MSDHRDVEDALRASLAEHARRAPTGAGLIEEIVSATSSHGPTPLSRARRWGTRTLPLVAAGAVAAVTIAIVGLAHPHHRAGPQRPAASRSVQPPTQPVPTSPAPSTATSPTAPRAVGDLINFAVTDVTFVGSDHGWALGTANCLRGQGTCTAMMRTTDGSSWLPLNNPPVNVGQVNGCASACAQGIRFADDQVGYAFGQNIFFMTTDGGATWQQQAGGADALETLDGNVIRLVSDHSGCPGPCNVRVEIAPIGSARWTTVSLPGGTVDAATVQLVRTGSRAFIESTTGHPGSLLAVTLYSSGDDGQHWTKGSDPCATTGSQRLGVNVSSQTMSPAPDGSVSILCGNGSGQGADQVVITSTDAGTTFTAGPRVTLPASDGGACCLAAVSATTFLVHGGSGWIYRTSDAGQSWHRVLQDRTNGTLVTSGFETSTTGRLLSADRRTIWTTHDAGLTWTTHTFN